jgi:hypothetical protein
MTALGALPGAHQDVANRVFDLWRLAPRSQHWPARLSYEIDVEETKCLKKASCTSPLERLSLEHVEQFRPRGRFYCLRIRDLHWIPKVDEIFKPVGFEITWFGCFDRKCVRLEFLELYERGNGGGDFLRDSIPVEPVQFGEDGHIIGFSAAR